MSTVEDLMTDPVLTVERTDSAAAVAEAMLEATVGSVVVIDEDCRPVGILTATDYVAMTAEGVDPHDATVGQLMADDVVTIEREASVDVAAAAMTDNDVEHLPVVDDDGQVVGILTTTDLTGYLARGE